LDNQKKTNYQNKKIKKLQKEKTQAKPEETYNAHWKKQKHKQKNKR
jgi:hypothetical protein